MIYSTEVNSYIFDNNDCICKLLEINHRKGTVLVLDENQNEHKFRYIGECSDTLTINECTKLEHYFDGYFDHSKYVYDPCINNNGACYRTPFIRLREWRDEYTTYVCPSLSEMKKVLLSGYWATKFDKSTLEYLLSVDNIHQFVEIIIKFKKCRLNKLQII